MRRLGLILLTAALPALDAKAAGPLAANNPYDQTTNVFDQASFFKPLQTDSDDIAFKLAPLLLQEAPAGTTNLEPTCCFGTLASSNGVVTVNSSPLTVYAESDTVVFNGKAHARMTYFWFYSAAAARERTTALPFQGVRLTLNSAGEPVIWEVVAEPEATILYVAQSIEMAAQREFGAPLPGRRYSVERALTNAPDVVVARVLDDGPVPMGPVVYLNSGSRRVSTVLCRCMPAQARHLLETRTFELRKDSLSSGMPARARAQTGLAAAFWPGEPDAPGGLESKLRLPRAF